MQALAPKNPQIAARLDLFDHRVPEELYHYASDPDATRNLIKDPAHAAQRDRLRQMLETWMEQTRDPMLTVFRQRDNPQAREAYMVQMAAEVAQHNASRMGDDGRPKNKKRKKKAE